MLYARVTLGLFIPNLVILPIFPKIGIYLFYNAFLLLPAIVLSIPIMILPKCPYCRKRILIGPLQDIHPDCPVQKGFWDKWFGSLIDSIKFQKIACGSCGKVSYF